VTGDHPGRVIPPHPCRPEDTLAPGVNRESTAHLLLGLAAAGERRARESLAAGVTVAGVATFPARRVWRSGLATPLRERADDVALSWERDGRELVGRARRRAYDAASPLVEQLTARVAEERVLERVVAELIARGTIARVTEELVEAGVAGQVVDGRLVDEVTDRVLASEEMRRVLGYVTKSPELRAALAEQSAGLASDMAVGVRARTSSADAVAERLAKSLLRRRPRP
jgi:hypothetical protein